jgi:hexosaminidase
MNIIPMPVRVEPLQGSFVLTADSVIVAGPGTLLKAEQLAEFLRPATGFALPVLEESSDVPAIHLMLDDRLKGLGAEGYELEVSGSGVKLRASSLTGLFYAGQSFRQLLPPEIFSDARVEMVWQANAVSISDQPRFGWRGVHLDCARHFMPLEFVFKLLDLMALHKLNTFHWHLTEDQGWRLEIKKYPKLTTVGAWRSQTIIGHGYQTDPKFDGKPHGGFYTQDQARAVVKYAASLHITVVPEIELPGHAQAAIAAYPEVGNTGAQLKVGERWGIIEHVLNPNESTIGGDECPKTEWKQSPVAQARMRELGLEDEDQMQAYFIGRMGHFLSTRGRKLIGWDEILEGGLASNATVMSWRGEAGGIEAARMGQDVVMTPGSHVYFDHYQSEDQSKEPLAIGGFTPLEKVYSYEPIPAELSAKEAKHVLGSQAQMWTEYVPTSSHAEYMIFPRLCALCEVLWTPAKQKDFAGFSGRLLPHLERLRLKNVNFRPLD